MFQESGHVVKLAGRLGEDERGLRRFGREQCDGGGRLTSEFLGEEFDVGEVTIGKSADDYFAAVGFGRLGEQGCGLRRGEFLQRMLPLLAERLDLVERLADLLRHIVDVRRKERSGFGERGKIVARGGDGALSGNEFDPVSLAHFFRFAQQEAANLSSVGDVGTTAGGEIEIMNIDEAQLIALRGWKFAQAKVRSFVASHEAYVNGTIFDDDFVGQAFGGLALILGNRRRIEIDGAIVVGHVERHGLHIEQSDKCSGEHVLAGVLLHVIAAAVGVNLAVDGGSGLNIFYRHFEIVDNLAVLSVGDFVDPQLGSGIF